MALIERHLCALVSKAWTGFGSVGAGRKSVPGKKRQLFPGFGPPPAGPCRPVPAPQAVTAAADRSVERLEIAQSYVVPAFERGAEARVSVS